LIVAGSSLAFLSIGTGLTYPLLYGLTSRHIKDSQPHNIGAGMAAFRVVCIVAEVTGQLSSSSLFHALSNKGVAWIVAGVSVGVGSIMCGLFAWYELIKRHRSY
jgi:MFS family permease